MADEDIKKEVENEEIVEPDITPITPGLDPPSPGVLEKIANALRPKKKEVEEIEETPEEEEIEEKAEEEQLEEKETEEKVEEEFEYTPIDSRFVDAAKAYGWDADRIRNYAENHDDIDVVTMTGKMEESTHRKSDTDKDTSDSKSLIDEEALKTLAEKSPELAEVIQRVIDPLAKRFEYTSSELDTLKGTLGNYEMDRRGNEEVRNQNAADKIFDSSEVSSLGKTADIPKYPDGSYVLNNPIVKEREKVWSVAQQFYANGGTFEEAMTNAMQWYSGGSAKKDAKRKVIKELKEQEERVMPKRHDTKVEKQYASEEERKAAIINDAVRKYNKEFPS